MWVSAILNVGSIIWALFADITLCIRAFLSHIRTMLLFDAFIRLDVRSDASLCKCIKGGQVSACRYEHARTPLVH